MNEDQWLRGGELCLLTVLRPLVAFILYVFANSALTRVFDAYHSGNLNAVPQVGNAIQMLISSLMLAVFLFIPFFIIVKGIGFVLSYLKSAFDPIVLSIALLPFIPVVYGFMPRSGSFQVKYRGCESYSDGSITECGKIILLTNFLISSLAAVFAILCVTYLINRKKTND